VDHSSWLTRPLPSVYLTYAASDLVNISALFQQFVAKGYIASILKEESQRYISIWNDRKPYPGEKFRNHAFLPLDIINYRHGGTSSTLRYKCNGCQRDLPEGCFPMRETWVHTGTSESSLGTRTGQCFVCRAVCLQRQKKEHQHQSRRKSRSFSSSYSYYDYDYDYDEYGHDNWDACQALDFEIEDDFGDNPWADYYLTRPGIWGMPLPYY